MEYLVIKSNRKTMSLSVNDDLIPVVRAPYFVSENRIKSFVDDNAVWIKSAVERKQNELEKYNLSGEELDKLIKMAEVYIPSRVEYYSRLMKLERQALKSPRQKNALVPAAAATVFAFPAI